MNGIPAIGINLHKMCIRDSDYKELKAEIDDEIATIDDSIAHFEIEKAKQQKKVFNIEDIRQRLNTIIKDVYKRQALISLTPDIKRVFMYNGAEHKCINCIEHGMELNVENVRKSSRQHKRCGTSFLLIVMLISIVFFLFIRVD